MTILRELDQVTENISRKSGNLTPAQSSLKSGLVHWGTKCNKGRLFDGDYLQEEIVAKMKQP